MKRFKHRIFSVTSLLAVLGYFALMATARADVFGSGENAFNIEFVTIGDPGNLADTTGDPNPASGVSAIAFPFGNKMR